MSHVIDQHIVPQFLLKNFSNKNQTHIWSFDKDAIEQRWKNKKNRAIKNTPTEKYFYDKVAGEKINSLEYKLSEVESNSEPAISQLIKSRNLNKLTNHDRDLIGEFIAYQILRTKQSFFNTARILDEFYKPIERLLNNPIERDTRDFWLNILKTADEYKAHILDKTWILAESNKQFYISDNPVVFQNSTNNRNGRGNLGLNTLGVEIYIPLSSSLVLCMFCKKTVTKTIPNIKSVSGNVENLNWLQVKNSGRFIFSQNGDFNLIENMISENAM